MTDSFNLNRYTTSPGTEAVVSRSARPGGAGIHPTCSLQIPEVTVGDEGNASMAIGLADVPYRKLVSWEEHPFNDVYLIDARTGRQHE